MARKSALTPIASEPGRLTYHRVRDAVRAAVDAGTFSPGEQLPATKVLSVQLGVSLVTVHRALQELVSAGVLRRGQGRGTFVHEEYQDRSAVSDGLRFGLVFHKECSLADSYHGQVLEGVRRGAADCGADLVILQFGEDWRNECNGFLYVNPFIDQSDRPPRPSVKRRTAEAAMKRPPIVVVGANWERENVWCVDTDNLDLARQAVRHLRGLGHRRIGYLGGGEQTSNTVDREQGFRAAMAELRLDAESGLVLRANGWKLEEEEQETLLRMLKSEDRPTAVFAGGFSLALGVYAVAQRAGLRVPQDLSIVGVDDARTAAHLTPPLTAMRQPLMEMGRRASLKLHALIRARQTEGREGREMKDGRDELAGILPRTLLKAEIVVRSSTSRPGQPAEDEPSGPSLAVPRAGRAGLGGREFNSK